MTARLARTTCELVRGLAAFLSPRALLGGLAGEEQVESACREQRRDDRPQHPVGEELQEPSRTHCDRAVDHHPRRRAAEHR